MKIIIRKKNLACIREEVVTSSSNAERIPNYKQWTAFGIIWSKNDHWRAEGSCESRILVQGEVYFAMGIVKAFQKYRMESFSRFVDEMSREGGEG